MNPPSAQPGPRLVVRTPAKINLGLEVWNRRPDGYHDLRTLMVAVDLWDTLRLESDPGAPPGEVVLSGQGPAIPLDDRNLVVRAANLLGRSYPGRLPGLRIHIEKSIPVGRGLGGGSSDAAAALLALNRLFGLGASRRELHRLAARIGMDAPFFLYGGAAVCVGRGEQVFPLVSAPTLPLVLLLPDFAVSTPEAYEGLQRRVAAPSRDRGAAPFPAVTEPRLGAASIRRSSGPLPEARLQAPGVPARWLRNDLEDSSAIPGIASDPSPGGAVRAMRRSLEQAGALASAMSGSGSAVFGVFPDDRSAEEAAGRLGASRELPGCRAVATRVISRREHRQALVGAPGNGAWPSG